MVVLGTQKKRSVPEVECFAVERLRLLRKQRKLCLELLILLRWGGRGRNFLVFRVRARAPPQRLRGQTRAQTDAPA